MARRRGRARRERLRQRLRLRAEDRLHRPHHVSGADVHERPHTRHEQEEELRRKPSTADAQRMLVRSTSMRLHGVTGLSRNARRQGRRRVLAQTLAQMNGGSPRPLPVSHVRDNGSRRWTWPGRRPASRSAAATYRPPTPPAEAALHAVRRNRVGAQPRVPLELGHPSRGASSPRRASLHGRELVDHRARRSAAVASVT